jgi:hypothetical protein
MTDLPYLLRRLGQQRNLKLTLAIGLFSAIGAVTILATHAATYQVALEAEDGTLNAGATQVSDAGASGGKAVKFAGTLDAGPTADVTSMGAACNGTTNDNAALQHALDTIPIGTALRIPAGRTCVHSGELEANRNGLHIVGPGTLLASDVANSALHITAPNITVENMTVSGVATVRDPQGRSTAAGIFIEGASGTVIRNVTFQGNAAGQGLGTNGIFNDNGTNFVFDNVTVNNSKADCIHNTNGAANGQITNPIVRNCGDDGVAVVSYFKDGKLCHDITIDSPKMYGQTWGRGLTVVGGKNITYKNFYIEDSFGAAIYVGTEGNEYNTYAVDNIQYLGGTIVRANKGASQVNHGAVLVTNYMQPSVTNTGVTVRDVTIQDTTAAAGKQLGIDGNPNSHIQFINITISGGTANVLDVGQTPANQYNATGITYNGAATANHVGYTP